MTPKNLKKKKPKKRNPLLHHKAQAGIQFVPRHVDLRTKFVLIGFICFQLLIENSYFLFPVENALQLHGHITGLYLVIFVLLVTIFLLLSYNHIFLKLICLFWISVQFFSVVVRIITNYYLYVGNYKAAILIQNDFSYFWIWIYFIIPIIYLFWRSKHFFDQPSNNYYKNGTFLLFKKPHDLLGLVLTLSWKPTSSVNIIHKDIEYYYKKGLSGFNKRPVTNFEENRLIKINPPINFTAFLESKLGSKYKFISNNCITILKGSGISIGLFDFIPSIFMARFSHGS